MIRWCGWRKSAGCTVRSAWPSGGSGSGQYYTLIWHDPAGAGQGEVEVVFQYQQGATASL